MSSPRSTCTSAAAAGSPPPLRPATASSQSAATSSQSPQGRADDDSFADSESIVELKFDLKWKHTVSASQSTSRVLLNQSIPAHNLEAFLNFLWRIIYDHPRTFKSLSDKDRGFMAILSAWVMEGDTNTFVEVNTEHSAEISSFIEHYIAFKKDDSRGSKIMHINGSTPATNLTWQTLKSWCVKPFTIFVYHRGRHLRTNQDYERLCPRAVVPRDRAQAPTISIAEERTTVARAHLGHMLVGTEMQWSTVGAHLAGLDNDISREYTLTNMQPAKFFKQLAPRNPLTNETLQYLKDVGSHARDLVSKTKRRVAHLEAIAKATQDALQLLNVQIELIKESIELDEERCRTFEAHLRLQENSLAMFWAARVTNMEDVDHRE